MESGPEFDKIETREHVEIDLGRTIIYIVRAHETLVEAIDSRDYHARMIDRAERKRTGANEKVSEDVETFNKGIEASGGIVVVTQRGMGGYLDRGQMFIETEGKSGDTYKAVRLIDITTGMYADIAHGAMIRFEDDEGRHFVISHLLDVE